MNNKNLRLAAVAALVSLGLAGCSTLEYVPIDRSNPQELQSRLTVGETVIVRLHNGDRRQFRIVALEADAIVGRDARVAYRDIDLLEVKTRDVEGTSKTALAVGALALVYVAAVAIDAELEEDSRAATRCVSNGMHCTPEQ